jgi:hypothetical protein
MSTTLSSGRGGEPRRAGPADFFETLCRDYALAERAAGRVDRVYAVGGQLLRLRFAGPALVPLLAPAFEHLAVDEDPERAGLTIHMWDSASTGASISPPPWSWDAEIVRGEVPGFNDERFRTLYLGSGSLNMLDLDAGRAVYWVRDARQVPYYESAAPFVTLLHWWMRGHGRQLVHAGAVGTPEGGVLLVGGSGSGKSTTALSCLASDLVYASDDYCLVAPDPEPCVYSLFNSAKLDLNSLRLLPRLADAVHNADRDPSEKALFFLQRHCPERLAGGFPLRAVVLPRVVGGQATVVSTVVKPASKMEALRALAPSTILQLPGADHRSMQMMSDLVRKVPCYRLELSPDVSATPGVISELLATLR